MAAYPCLDLARVYATGWSMGGGGVSVLGWDVALVAVGGHGHSWPSSAEAATWALTTMEIDATAMIWGFFEQHPMP